MDARIPLAEALMREFPELYNDQLVFTYAAKGTRPGPAQPGQGPSLAPAR